MTIRAFIYNTREHLLREDFLSGNKIVLVTPGPFLKSVIISGILDLQTHLVDIFYDNYNYKALMAIEQWGFFSVPPLL